MKNVLDIVYNYSLQDKLLDKQAVLLITEILMEEFNIDNVDDVSVRGIDFKHAFDGTLAFKKGSYICFFLPRIHAYIASKTFPLNQDDEFLDKFNIFLRNNLFIVHTIIHELTHSMEEMHIRDNQDDLETKLLTIEYEYVSEIERRKNYDGYKSSLRGDFDYKKELKNYRNNYNLSLYERIADINAYENVLKIIEPIKTDIPTLYNIETFLLYNRQLSTYKDGFDMPTLRFFVNINMIERLLEKDIDLIHEDLATRLRLGLRLDHEEYNDLKHVLEIKK